MAKKLDLSNNTTPDVDTPHISKSTKELANKKLKELMQEEGKLVRGIFQCFESPGGTQRITYKKYPTPAEMRKRGGEGGLEPFSKVMTDGMEYEIPLYVARFLNGTDVTVGAMGDEKPRSTQIGTCAYNIHGFKSTGDQLAPSALGTGIDGSSGIPVPIVGVMKKVRRYGFQSLEFAHGVA